MSADWRSSFVLKDNQFGCIIQALSLATMYPGGVNIVMIGWTVQHLETQFREELGPRPLFNWLRKLLGRPIVERSVIYRGIDFRMAHFAKKGRGYDDYRSLSVPVDASGTLSLALVAMGLDSGHLRTLAHDTEILCRRIANDGGLADDDWRQQAVRELRRLEHELLFREVVAANPGRSVCVDSFGITIG